MTTVDPRRSNGIGLRVEAEKMASFNVTDLSSPDNPVRSRFVALFCAAVYSDSPGAASDLIRDCMAICGGDKDLLSKVLQSTWLIGNTPLHWVVSNIQTTKHKTLPPLVEELLDSCGSPLTQVARDSIEAACCQRDDNTLFRLIEKRLSSGSPSFEDIVEITPSRSMSFIIPMFPDRMLMSEVLQTRFIMQGGLYTLSFHSKVDGWTAILVFSPRPGDVLKVRRPTWVSLVFKSATDGLSGSCNVASVFQYDSSTFPVDFLRARNPHVGSDRKLSLEMNFTVF
ncbi:hypothetical protein DFP72DRAFT_875489 [Ephemerocybe angulata]|uniref:Uncharacterized protein n=1 Tax=Ephemerocybe angulata TaxID=980116 RepID=A0A8H6IFI0_9AGAR|nr:hypothetical protein DFP72DRAFT_875489 [Tulosesus angulatus]